MQGTMPGARRRGRPRTAWMDNIKTWTGLSVEESIRMTEDRDKWRKYVHHPWCGRASDRGRLQNRTELQLNVTDVVIPGREHDGRDFRRLRRACRGRCGKSRHVVSRRAPCQFGGAYDRREVEMPRRRPPARRRGCRQPLRRQRRPWSSLCPGPWWRARNAAGVWWVC